MNQRVFRFKPGAPLFLAGLLMAGCATTQITTMSRDNAASQKYSKVLVVIPSENDDLRNQYEEEFSDDLSGQGVAAVPSLTVMPSQLDIQSDQATLVYKDNEIGAVVLIKDLAPYPEMNDAPTNRKPKPRLRHEIDFYDAASMHLLWSAETITEGELMASSRVMIRSFFRHTIKALKQQKLLMR